MEYLHKSQPILGHRSVTARSQSISRVAIIDIGGLYGMVEKTEYGVTEYGVTEYGVTEYGVTKYGVTEYGVTEYGVRSHGVRSLFMLYLLQFCPGQTSTCFGCGNPLKQGTAIPDAPNDLVVVSKMPREWMF